MSRVAVVTGGNKGIGLAIVEGLCRQYDGIVYLTARDVNRGTAAVAELEKLGLKPKFHELDITDDSSVNKFRDYLKNTYGGLDVLVNNAAIAFKAASTEPFGYQAEETTRVNYFSLIRVCDALFPLLRPHARVVHVSSSAGHLSEIPGENLKKKFANPKLTVEELNNLIRSFVDAAKADTYREAGWPGSTYVVSKVGVSALARIHQRAFDADPREDIVVNSVHPGYVDTDMTSHKGHLTPKRGAEAPIYCALLPANTDIKGKYIWHDKSLVDWIDDPKPSSF